MGMGYGISSIGTNYASDPYFMQALSSPNMLAMMQAQQLAQQQAAVQGTQGVDSATAGATATSPSFQGSEATTAAASSGSGLGTGLIVGGTIATGALACLAAYKKRDGGSLLNGFKNLGKSLFGSKGVTAAGEKAKSFVSNLIKDGGKNLQEYTIKKNGTSFLMKDGKPVKIITQDKKVIDKAKDVADWVRKNPSIQAEVRKLSLTGTTLPKGVTLSYTKEIADGKNLYKLVVENGKVVKVSSKDKGGKWVEVAEDQFEGFIKNHAKQVKEAETLTRTFSGKKVQLLNKKGKLVSQTGSIQISVTDKEITNADAIRSYLEKNGDIKTELENIASTGSISEGYRLGNVVYKNDNGVTFNINGDKISSIKLDKKTEIDGTKFKAGTIIDGKWLGKWRALAENNNQYQAILEMIK